MDKLYCKVFINSGNGMKCWWSLLWCSAIICKTFTIMAEGEQDIQYIITINCSNQLLCNLLRWNLIGGIQFKHEEKLPNVRVVQWLGMFWLDSGRCIHDGWWNVSCLACKLWVKERKETPFNLKMTQMMRTFHIPLNLDLNRQGSREGHKPLQLGNLLFQICVQFR